MYPDRAARVHANPLVVRFAGYTLRRDTIRVTAVVEGLTLHCDADAVTGGRVPTTCGLQAIDEAPGKVREKFTTA